MSKKIRNSETITGIAYLLAESFVNGNKDYCLNEILAYDHKTSLSLTLYIYEYIKYEIAGEDSARDFLNYIYYVAKKDGALGK